MTHPHEPALDAAARDESYAVNEARTAFTPGEIEKDICDEIADIVKTYREQEARGYVDTPGGLEHMGDVWNLLFGWDEQITRARGHAS